MSQHYLSSRRKQAGITSLFVVIFSTILLSIITLSFAYMMNREVQRSSDDELSQSAYDSAMAGVEDAKRVIMLARSGNQAARDAIELGECNTVAEAGVAGSPGDTETIIQSTTTGVGAELNQAYTCVTIDLDSDDYVSSIDQPMRSAFVPLTATDEFDRVRVEWHATTADGIENSCSDSSPELHLCQAAAWGDQATVPALLRAQLITPGDNISYSTLDSSSGGTTAFLYPKSLGGSLGVEIAMNGYQRYVNAVGGSGGSANRLEMVECEDDLSYIGGYRCQATLVLSDPISAGSELSLLRLTPVYNATSFRVSLLDGSNQVQFAGVQPVVDSTGRANDLFRRVEARLSLASDAEYPEYAIDVDGDICKDFYVYQGGSGRSSGSCSP